MRYIFILHSFQILQPYWYFLIVHASGAEGPCSCYYVAISILSTYWSSLAVSFSIASMIRSSLIHPNAGSIQCLPIVLTDGSPLRFYLISSLHAPLRPYADTRSALIPFGYGAFQIKSSAILKLILKNIAITETRAVSKATHLLERRRSKVHEAMTCPHSASHRLLFRSKSDRGPICAPGVRHCDGD